MFKRSTVLVLVISAILLPPVHASTLKVLTHNVFLLDVNSQSKQSIPLRLPMIAGEHAKLGPDIIGLQEVWGSPYRNRLIQDYRQHGYPHHAYAAAGHILSPALGVSSASAVVSAGSLYAATRSTRPLTRRTFLGLGLATGGFAGFALYADTKIRDLGNGLLLVSKYPVRNVTSMYFVAFTRPEEVFIYKGAMKAEVKVPDVGWVDFVVTHLGARHFDKEAQRYLVSDYEGNLNQLTQLVSWIEALKNSRPEDYSGAMVLMGDLNFSPKLVRNSIMTDTPHPGYTQLTSSKGLGLVDSHAAIHGLELPLAATDGPQSAYAAQRIKADGIPNFPDEHIDLIFASKSQLTPTDSAVVLNEFLPESPEAAELCKQYLLPRLPLQLSDHFGVLSTFDAN